ASRLADVLRWLRGRLRGRLCGCRLPPAHHQRRDADPDRLRSPPSRRRLDRPHPRSLPLPLLPLCITSSSLPPRALVVAVSLSRLNVIRSSTADTLGTLPGGVNQDRG